MNNRLNKFRLNNFSAKYFRQNELIPFFRCSKLEIANWMIGEETEECSGDIGGGTLMNDNLLTIIIENAYENTDILLPTLQFVESLLDNTNERILHGMLFRYVNSRRYYDNRIGAQPLRSWSDEEDDREKKEQIQRGTIRSKTLAPPNILKVINQLVLSVTHCIYLILFK